MLAIAQDKICYGSVVIGPTELSCPLAVNGSAGPVVRPSHVPVLAESDHGLNGESHAWFALSDSLVLGVVRHVGGTVEDAVDTMATVRPDHAAVLLLGMLLNHIAKIAYQRARLHHLDSFIQTLARRLYDADSVRIRFGTIANVIGLVEVAVETLMVQGNIQIDDIAIQQNALVRNSVANDLVRRSAYRLREVVVVQGRRVRLGSLVWYAEDADLPPAYISFDTCLVADLIQVVGCNAGLELRSHDIEHFSGQPTDLAHALLRL
jgi:hypothetical protein